VTYPKIELHVHLEATVRPETLLEIAARNGYPLPAETPAEVEALYEFRDLPHFVDVFFLVASTLQRSDDFRQVVVDYAAEAKRHGAVYVEGIFVPGLGRGLDGDEVFSGYCDGVQEARELHGLELRLTPDIPRGYTAEQAETVVRLAAKYRDRGVVGVGLGGVEDDLPPMLYERAFEQARAEGLGSVPHAGEIAGPASIRGALDVLGADRIRHGIRAVDDPDLVAELVERAIVLDVTPVSNLRTGAVASLDEHPLPRLVAEGVLCSLSTDDPVMFGTDLTHEYELAVGLGLDPRGFYDAAVAGVLCDDALQERLRELGEGAWEGPVPAGAR
jgi:aminodeoxyfutalosine deaminase